MEKKNLFHFITISAPDLDGQSLEECVNNDDDALSTVLDFTITYCLKNDFLAYLMDRDAIDIKVKQNSIQIATSPQWFVIASKKFPDASFGVKEGGKSED